MTVIGKVYRVRKNTAYVRSSRPESCEGCASRAMCKKNEADFRAYDPLGVSVGDTVEVETREDGISMLIIAYIFLTPVLIIFLTYFLYTLHIYLTFSAVIFVAAYFYALRKINLSYDPQIKIIKLVEKAEG